MKISIKYLLMAIIFLIGCKGTNYSISAEDDQYFKDRMIENLDLATVWVVKDGIRTYVNSGREGVFRYLLDTFGVGLWADVVGDDKIFLDQFAIRGKGIYHQIVNLFRVEIEGHFYEFWIVKVTGTDWAEVERRSEFFVTRTNDIYGNREILERSPQFIASYQEGEIKIEFPTDNLDLLYVMEPWLYKGHYDDTDIEDREVIIRGGVAQYADTPPLLR